MQVFQFKKKAMKLLASLCYQAMEKSPLRYFFARCLKGLSPNFMVESSRSCELMFEKLLEKLVSYKRLTSREADAAKLESNLTNKLIASIPLFGNFSLISANLNVDDIFPWRSYC